MTFEVIKKLEIGCLLLLKRLGQADAIDTNIAVGSAPGAGGENSWLYFDLKVESAMTFGRTSDDDADCQGIVYGSDDGENWSLYPSRCG